MPITAEREKLFVEERGAGHGLPYLIDAGTDENEVAGKLFEDGADLASHAGAALSRRPPALQDRMRQAERNSQVRSISSQPIEREPPDAPERQPIAALSV